MLAPSIYHVAAALIWNREDALLLVRQQGPRDKAAYWALPGGQVKPGEFLMQGLYREVREETGLQITGLGEVVYTARVENLAHGYRSHTRVFAVHSWEGELQIADPDQLVLEAAFVPREEALARLALIPWRVMREPLLAYLQGKTASGCVWLYNQEGDGEPELIRRLPGREGA